MNPILVHPEPGIFPGNPSNEFSDCANLAASGVFGIGFAIPRVALHHSCFAILIVASPGVIISVIPAGIFAVYVPQCWFKFAWTLPHNGHKRRNFYLMARGTSETLALVWAVLR